MSSQLKGCVQVVAQGQAAHQGAGVGQDRPGQAGHTVWDWKASSPEA
jgi:hypothetical protein